MYFEVQYIVHIFVVLDLCYTVLDIVKDYNEMFIIFKNDGIIFNMV